MLEVTSRLFINKEGGVDIYFTCSVAKLQVTSKQISTPLVLKVKKEAVSD